jgi:hypothetical protein
VKYSKEQKRAHIDDQRWRGVTSAAVEWMTKTTLRVTQALFVMESDYIIPHLPFSQEMYKSPLVRKHATEWRARWCIQPCVRSWHMIASIQGNPVRLSSHACVYTGWLYDTVDKLFIQTRIKTK